VNDKINLGLPPLDVDEAYAVTKALKDLGEQRSAESDQHMAEASPEKFKRDYMNDWPTKKPQKLAGFDIINSQTLNSMFHDGRFVKVVRQLLDPNNTEGRSNIINDSLSYGFYKQIEHLIRGNLVVLSAAYAHDELTVTLKPRLENETNPHTGFKIWSIFGVDYSHYAEYVHAMGVAYFKWLADTGNDPVICKSVLAEFSANEGRKDLAATAKQQLAERIALKEVEDAKQAAEQATQALHTTANEEPVTQSTVDTKTDVVEWQFTSDSLEPSKVTQNSMLAKQYRPLTMNEINALGAEVIGPIAQEAYSNAGVQKVNFVKPHEMTPEQRLRCQIREFVNRGLISFDRAENVGSDQTLQVTQTKFLISEEYKDFGHYSAFFYSLTRSDYHVTQAAEPQAAEPQAAEPQVQVDKNGVAASPAFCTNPPKIVKSTGCWALKRCSNPDDKKRVQELYDAAKQAVDDMKPEPQPYDTASSLQSWLNEQVRAAGPDIATHISEVIENTTRQQYSGSGIAYAQARNADNEEGLALRKSLYENIKKQVKANDAN